MRISIAIRNFNRGNQIERAIRSVQNQVRLGFEIEILVIDDASSDGSIELLRSFQSEICLYQNPINLGVGGSSQKALEMSTGEFFMLVDSDDYLSPISSSALFLALEANPTCTFAYGDIYRVDVKSRVRTLVSLTEKENLLQHGAGVLFKTNALQDVGGFDVSLRNCEDTDLFLRLIARNHLGTHVPLPLYRYNIHGENISRSQEQRDIYERLISGE